MHKGQRFPLAIVHCQLLPHSFLGWVDNTRQKFQKHSVVADTIAVEILAAVPRQRSNSHWPGPALHPVESN